MNNAYVITGRYLDNSGFYLFGVYESYGEAHDRVEIARAAQPGMEVCYWRLPVGEICLTDVAAFKPGAVE